MGVTATNLLLASQGVGAFAGAGAAYAKSWEYKGEESVNRTNARMSDWQAEDAVARGEWAAQQHLREKSQMIGAQRAGLGGQGIDVTKGTAAQLQLEAATQGAADAAQIRNNAWREAMGFRTQAMNYRIAARGAKSASRNTLISGGVQFARDLMNTGYTYYKGA